MLTKIKNRILPEIGVLHWLAAKHIFEKQNFTSVDAAVLEEGIEGWMKKPDLSDMDKWEIKRIVNALVADERGHFNRIKEMLIQLNVSYRQFYHAGLPFIRDPQKCRTFGRG
jgi:hypothetical protein